MSTASQKWIAAFSALTILLAMPVSSAFAATTAAPADTTATPATTAAPAATPTAVSNLYSVNVAGGKINFIKDGAQVGSYSTNGTDLTLSINNNGNLLVGFPNSRGGNSSVTLGDQRSVEISGTANSITAHNSLGGSVSLTTAADSNISTITLNAPIETRIYGTVGAINVQAAADVIVEKGASVTRARLVNSNSLLTANGTVKTVEKNSKSLVNGSGVIQTTSLTTSSPLANGTSIARSKSGLIIDGGGTPLLNNGYRATTSSSGLRNNTSSGATTTTTSGNVRLTASTIYADYRDELRSLIGDLADNVRAYDRDTGKRIYGDVYWVNNEYTEVTRTGTYTFAFEADNGNYGEVRGRVRIVVDNDDYYYDRYDRYDRYDDDRRGTRSYYIEKDNDGEIDTGYTRGDEVRLEDFESELEDMITAYDKSTDNEIDGEVRWVSPNKRVTSTSSHSFRFYPDDSRYPTKTGSVRLVFDRD